jgi:hypothetical protein
MWLHQRAALRRSFLESEVGAWIDPCHRGVCQLLTRAKAEASNALPAPHTNSRPVLVLRFSASSSSPGGMSAAAAASTCCRSGPDIQRLVVLVVLPQPRHGDLVRHDDARKKLRAVSELPRAGSRSSAASARASAAASAPPGSPHAVQHLRQPVAHPLTRQLQRVVHDATKGASGGYRFRRDGVVIAALRWRGERRNRDADQVLWRLGRVVSHPYATARPCSSHVARAVADDSEKIRRLGGYRHSPAAIAAPPPAAAKAP